MFGFSNDDRHDTDSKAETNILNANALQMDQPIIEIAFTLYF